MSDQLVRMWLVDDSRIVTEHRSPDGERDITVDGDYPTPIADIIETVWDRFDEAGCQSDLHPFDGSPWSPVVGWGLGEDGYGIPHGEFRPFYVVDDGRNLFVVCEDCGPPARRQEGQR